MTYKMRGLVAACLLLPSAAWSEQLVNATDPEGVLEIAKGFGFAMLETDTMGDPKITGRIEGLSYSVYFYGCSDNKDCKHINFRSGFVAESKLSRAERMEKANEWNASKVFGTVHLDSDDDYAVGMPVNLTYGVTKKNLDSVFSTWKVVIEQFKEF